jgi:hypothetical protein
MMPDLQPMTDPLSIYLNDHLAGATAGLELFRRAGANVDAAHKETLRRLTDEVAEDRVALIDLMTRLEIPVRQYKVLVGWVGEKIGRLKPNGQLTGRAPLSSVIELETLLLGVRGKAASWQALRIVAEQDERLSIDRLDELITRAERQSAVLEQLRRDVAAEVFVAG